MLVLSRKLGESLVIADNVVVTVLEVRGDRVKLGIAAPVEIPVVRDELLARGFHRPAFPADLAAKQGGQGLTEHAAPDSRVL